MSVLDLLLLVLILTAAALACRSIYRQRKRGSGCCENCTAPCCRRACCKSAAAPDGSSPPGKAPFRTMSSLHEPLSEK